MRNYGRRTWTIVAVAIILILAVMGVTAGCGSSAEGQPSSTAAPVTSQTTATTAATPTTATTANQATTTTAAADAGTQTITDAAGRQVTIPKQIKKIFSTSPMGTIMVYSLNPDKLLAWNTANSDAAQQFLTPGTRNLANLSGWYAANTANAEDVIKAKPDFILSVDSADPATDAATKTQSDKLQAQLGIPFVVLDGRLNNIADTYELLGKLTGDEDQATALANYCRNALADVKAKAATIPDDKKVKAYYAEGTEGLQTEGPTSPHAVLFSLVGANNVADIDYSPGTGGAGMDQVSMEQVLTWNPDVIVVGISMASSKTAFATDAYQLISSGQRSWSAVNAVKNKKVYAMPTVPFSWIDRPPSANQYIGMKWLADLLYPDVYKYDMRAEVTTYFKLFYHVDVTDAQLDQLLGAGN